MKWLCFAAALAACTVAYAQTNQDAPVDPDLSGQEYVTPEELAYYYSVHGQPPGTESDYEYWQQFWYLYFLSYPDLEVDDPEYWNTMQ